MPVEGIVKGYQNGNDGVVITEVVPGGSGGVGNPILGSAVQDTTAVIAGNTETIAAALTWVQAGPPGAPPNFLAWQIQPADLPPEAPFECWVESSVFNTTRDTRYMWGSNASRLLVAQPFARWILEQDYEIVPGTHHFEVHLEMGTPGGAVTVRPLFFSFDRATGATQTELFCGPGALDSILLGWRDGVGGNTVQGSFPRDPAQPILLGIGGQNFEIDAQLFTLAAGSNVVLQSVAGFAQLWGSSHTYLDSNGPVHVRPSGQLDMADFTNAAGNAGLHFYPTPMAVPAAPATGFVLFIDVADNKLKAIGTGGTVTILAVP